MDNIETLVISNYEQSMLYFQEKHPLLYNKLQALEILLGEGTYPQQYDLEYKDGYFDVVELSSGGFLYNCDSDDYSKKMANGINFKKNEHTIETFYNRVFTDESVEKVKNLPANFAHATTAPIINYYNKYITTSMLMKKIHKFIFFGVGLGLHMDKIIQKTNADVFFIIEDNLEIFRLSLFTCNYKKIFNKKECFFSIKQNHAEMHETFMHFYDYAFIRNHYLKFSVFAEKDKMFIKNIQASILNRSEHSYSNSALIEKGARVLIKMREGYKFYNTLKKDEKFFDDKPIMVLGAGPSLGENVEWLMAHRNNFIIVAPFVTLRALYHLGIAPDILVHIDEGDLVAKRDIDLYGDKKEFFKNTSFIFSASIPSRYFEAFDKESIYLIEDRTTYKLNDNYLEIGSVGEAVYTIALNLTQKDIYLLGLDLALKDDGSSHTKTHMTKTKADVSSADRVEDVADLRKTTFKVKGNFQESVYTIALFSSSIRIMDTQTKRFKLPNQNVYNLSNGAYFVDTTPLHVKDIAFENEEKSEYGAVFSEYLLTYYGFYKQTDSENIYDVNVYVDKKLVETIKADKTIKLMDDKYDIQGNSFEYRLGGEYIGKEHLVEFKEAISGESLAGSGVTTLDLSDVKFNEFRFRDSLNYVDEEKVKDLYCKDAIGFVATKDNLEDKDFVNYLKELYVRFPQVTFKAFYFNSKQKERIEKVFINEINRIILVMPHNTYDFAKEIEILLIPIKNIHDVFVLNIVKYSQNIMLNIFKSEPELLNTKLNKIAPIPRDNKQLLILKGMGISDENIEKNNYRFLLSLWSDFFIKNNIDYKFDSNITNGEFRNDRIALGLKYPLCKKYIIESTSVLFNLYGWVK